MFQKTFMSILTNIIEVAIEDFMWIFMLVNGMMNYGSTFITDIYI